MHFIKINPEALFPTLNSPLSTVCNLKAFQHFTIPANQLTEICLGIMLVHLKRNFVLQIKNIHNAFKIINQFWVPTSNLLTLSVYAHTTVVIPTNELLCQLQPLAIEHLLPGKK